MTVLLFAACGGEGAIPEGDILVSLRTEAKEIESGKAFPLTVVRVWRKDLTPAPFDAAALAPLVLRRMSASRREDDRRIEETLRGDAYAFGPGKTAIPALTFSARAGAAGPEISARSEPVELSVRPALPPGAPGPPELPDGPLDEPGPGPWTWALAGAAAAAALGFVLWRRRRSRRARAAPAAPAPAGPAPVPVATRTLERLRRLRALEARTREEVEAWYVEAADLVRAYAGERFSLRAGWMTTEELAAALARCLPAPAPPSDPRSHLRRILRRCDLVKFACQVPPPPERETLLAEAAAFVEATSPAGEAAPAPAPAAGSPGSPS